MKIYRKRRLIAISAAIASLVGLIIANPASYETFLTPSSEAEATAPNNNENVNGQILATDVLAMLPIKGRAPKTGYSREEFYSSWPKVESATCSKSK